VRCTASTSESAQESALTDTWCCMVVWLQPTWDAIHYGFVRCITAQYYVDGRLCPLQGVCQAQKTFLFVQVIMKVCCRYVYQARCGNSDANSMPRPCSAGAAQHHRLTGAARRMSVWVPQYYTTSCTCNLQRVNILPTSCMVRQPRLTMVACAMTVVACFHPSSAAGFAAMPCRAHNVLHYTVPF